MERGDHFQILIEEAIQLELHIGELYLLFHRLFPKDSEFWWKLALEEENHAALLKTVKQMNSVQVHIPGNLLPENIEVLRKSIRLVNEMKGVFEKDPDRNRAFQFSYKVETSAGELHYNSFMKHAPDSPVSMVFKRLNGDDVDHAERIRAYMEAQRIPL